MSHVKPVDDPVLSRHRLPRFYRVSLAVLWLLPGLVFVVAMAVFNGARLALFDPRLLLPLGVMALPAWYIWQEGVDVTQGGMVVRVHVPRYYPYSVLGTWYLDDRAEKRTLTVWDMQRYKVLECRMGHLTDLPDLLRALERHVRRRAWYVR